MEITTDGFLGERLQIAQPVDGYRAATDPVYLAASIPANAGDRILDVGCGVGTASLCLGVRVAGLSLTGIELQNDYAVLAHSNALKNGQTLSVVCSDLMALPQDLRGQSYDHVLTNPPFFMSGGLTAPNNPSKTLAHVETMNLDLWISISLKRLKPRGSFSIIHLADRLPTILTAMNGPCGNIRVLPIAARHGRAAKRVLVQGVKTSKAPLELLAPLIVHAGETHEKDGDDYGLPARGILRDADALTL
jgi:tRNA1(Val) A37 N6-methylase TrmN6